MRVCMPWLVLGAAALLAAPPALAVYRCNAQGNLHYSDAPCPAGQESARLTPMAPADPNQARQEQAQLERQKQQLQRLRNERERSQAAEESARMRAEAGRQAHAKRCKLLELKARWSEEDAAQAGIKQHAKARRSAQRKQEQYQLECGKSP